MKKGDSNSVQALWVALGSLSSFGLSIISAAILSRYFDKIEYGTYRQVLYVYNTLLIIFAVGLPKVFAYYLPRYDREQAVDIVWKLNKLLIAAGAAFSLFLYLLSGTIATLLKNPELSIGLKYFSPIPFFLLPTMGIEGIFSTYKKTINIAIYNTITRTIMLLFIVLPVVLLNGTYIYAIYGWIVASIISFFISFWFKGIPFRNIKAKKTNLSYFEILAYSLPLVFASFAGIAIKAADQFYISRFFGTEIFAEFANGFMEIPFVNMVTSATATVLMPIFSKQIYNKAELKGTIELWRNAILKSAMIIYPMIIFFIFNADNIIILLYSSIYSNSIIYFRIAMLLNFFNIIVFAPLLFALGKTKYYALLHVFFAILAWSGGYLTILIFNSPIAIAIFSVSLGIIKILIFAQYTSGLLGITFFEMVPTTKILRIILHSFILVSILNILTSQLLPQAHPAISLTVNCVGFSVLLLITATFFKLEYRKLLEPILKKFIIFK